MRAVVVPMVAFLLLLGSGCSTVVVNRASGAAAAGTAYVAALKEVNDLAVTKSLEFGAVKLANDVNRDVETLNDEIAAQRDRIRIVGESSDYLAKLAQYFEALEALAKGDASAEIGEQVGKIASDLTRTPASLNVPAERQAALSGLAAYVSKQAHATIVSKALERDADTIARAIATSDEMLSVVSVWIERYEGIAIRQDFQANILAPYRDKKPLGADWRAKLIQYQRGSPTQEVVKNARKASANMQTAWRSILSGEYSFAEVLATLKEIQTGLDAINAVKKNT